MMGVQEIGENQIHVDEKTGPLLTVEEKTAAKESKKKRISQLIEEVKLKRDLQRIRREMRGGKVKKSGEKDAKEEDKKFLALAAPFVAWLKEADEESEDSDEASEDSDSDE